MTKPTPTVQLKERFLALYLGQTVLFTGKGRPNHNLGAETILQANNLYLCAFLPQRALKLRALSGITNEECDFLYYLYSPDSERMGDAHVYGRILVDAIHHPISNGWFALSMFDYLRSRGFALPFSGYDVAELTQLGWIQLQYEPQ